MGADARAIAPARIKAFARRALIHHEFLVPVIVEEMEELMDPNAEATLVSRHVRPDVHLPDSEAAFHNLATRRDDGRRRRARRHDHIRPVINHHDKIPVVERGQFTAKPGNLTRVPGEVRRVLPVDCIEQLGQRPLRQGRRVKSECLHPAIAINVGVYSVHGPTEVGLKLRESVRGDFRAGDEVHRPGPFVTGHAPRIAILPREIDLRLVRRAVIGKEGFSKLTRSTGRRLEHHDIPLAGRIGHRVCEGVGFDQECAVAQHADIGLPVIQQGNLGIDDRCIRHNPRQTDRVDAPGHKRRHHDWIGGRTGHGGAGLSPGGAGGISDCHDDIRVSGNGHGSGRHRYSRQVHLESVGRRILIHRRSFHKRSGISAGQNHPQRLRKRVHHINVHDVMRIVGRVGRRQGAFQDIVGGPNQDGHSSGHSIDQGVGIIVFIEAVGPIEKGECGKPIIHHFVAAGRNQHTTAGLDEPRARHIVDQIPFPMVADAVAIRSDAHAAAAARIDKIRHRRP